MKREPRRAASARRRPEGRFQPIASRHLQSCRARRARRFSEISGGTMRISARNQLKGKVVDIRKGATTAHVRIEIGNGIVVTSSITNDAVDELGLKVGSPASAIIKASDVMVAID
jgi:molybdopterin-binding protein